MTEQEPWKVAKDDAQIERLHTILYVLCDSLRAIAVLHHALMPRVTALMWEQIGAVVLGDIADQRVQHVAEWGQLPVGAHVTKGEILFPRLEDPVEA